MCVHFNEAEYLAIIERAKREIMRKRLARKAEQRTRKALARIKKEAQQIASPSMITPMPSEVREYA